MQLGFGAGILTGIATSDATGASVANATPVQFGTLQDISTDLSFEEKLLYGAYQFPIAVGRGKGKFSFKAKQASLSGLILSDLFFGLPAVAGIKNTVQNFAASVPGATTYTITVAPPSSGTFVKDLGVLSGTTGVPFKKVASAPATGQYSVSALGVYTFAAADANAAVLISYEYSAVSTAGPKSIAITNQLMGYAPEFQAVLNMSFQGKAVTLSLNRCTSSKFSLPFKNDDFVVPEFEFSAMADGAGNIGYIAVGE
jgi:carbon monoxide dehydrogenase subunit G